MRFRVFWSTRQERENPHVWDSVFDTVSYFTTSARFYFYSRIGRPKQKQIRYGNRFSRWTSPWSHQRDAGIFWSLFVKNDFADIAIAISCLVCLFVDDGDDGMEERKTNFVFICIFVASRDSRWDSTSPRSSSRSQRKIPRNERDDSRFDRLVVWWKTVGPLQQRLAVGGSEPRVPYLRGIKNKRKVKDGQCPWRPTERNTEISSGGLACQNWRNGSSSCCLGYHCQIGEGKKTKIK